MPFLSVAKGGELLLRIHVQPRSSRNRLCGVHGDALKLAITAPPVDGKANTAVIAFLADFFRVAKKDITIVAGTSSRRKTCALTRLTEQEARSRLQVDV